MLPSRTIMSLGLAAALGWLSPAPIRAVDLTPFQLDDSKAFASLIETGGTATGLEKPPAPAPVSDSVRGGVMLTRADDGLFYASVMVNGEPVRFVVDTGSSMVVLTPDDARRLGLGIAAGDDQMMHTAGGSVRIGRTSLNHVVIGGKAIRHVDAVVVRGGLPTSLLGQNLLARLGSITIEGDRLSLD